MIAWHYVFSSQTNFYNFEGKKISEKTTPFNFLDSYHFKNDSIAYCTYLLPVDNGRDSIFREIWLVKNDSVYQHFLPYDTKKGNLTSREILISLRNKIFFFIGTDTSIFFIGPYGYTFYELTPHSLIPKFTLILPLSHSYPMTFFLAPCTMVSVLKLL